MHVDVNGTRPWFDVDGPALVPDGPEMRQRPTVVLVHGGPGVWDHSYFKPDFAALAEHAQLSTSICAGTGGRTGLDPVTPVAAAEEIVATLPEGVAQLEVIDGAGHWAWKDAPGRFWPMIAEFIHNTVARERLDA